MDEKYIKINYNFFDSIKEQLDKQGYECKDIEIFEEAKDNIIFLYVQNILTDSEKDKLINKLHKKIVKNITINLKGVNRR